MYLTSEPIVENEFLGQSIDPSCGAVCSFLGRVRNHNEGRTVSRLYYESYEPMAEKMIHSIILDTTNKFGISGIRVIHRLGWLETKDVAVIIECSAVHRAEAFDACRTVIDRIKSEVPIWKKEIYSNGTSQWTGCSSFEGAEQGERLR